MRATWTGAISFGLVSIPVRLFRAVEEHRIRFRYLHRECRTPLEIRRYCPFHEEVVPWEEVVRGYEVAPDEYIVMERDELEQVEAAPGRRIEIQAFVDLDEIDPIHYDTSYYAEPLAEGRPAYALLQQAMQQTARVAVARLTLRGREILAAIRPYQNALLIETLYYADEIRPVTSLALPTEAVPPRELRTAIRLIESLAEPFVARRYTDEYHRRLMSLIEEKAEARVPVGGPPERAPTERTLLGDLQASLSVVEEIRREAR